MTVMGRLDPLIHWESGIELDEAQLIHYGLPVALRPTYDVTDEPPAELSVNMGALFAQMLFERKFRGFRPLDKKPLDESIDSLLTRIFKHHDIDLSDTLCPMNPRLVYSLIDMNNPKTMNDSRLNMIREQDNQAKIRNYDQD
ncbi:hypothetical protein YC2023_083648 [Brassica napus]